MLMKQYIEVSSVDELKNNIGNFVKFICTRCNKISSRKIRKDRPRTYEDLLCAKCHRELTCLNKYGVISNFQIDGFVEHSVAKKIAKYGNACNLQKRYRTCQDKYGVNNYCETNAFKKQCIDTIIKHSGSVKQSYRDRARKGRDTKLQRYGSETYHNVESFRKTIVEKRKNFELVNDCISLNSLIQEYGQGFKALNLPKIYDNSKNAYISTNYLNEIIDYASKCHNLKATSKTENEIYDFVCSIYKGMVVKNTFSYLRNEEGNAIELDIYIPEIKLGIEYNGIYWHSTTYKNKSYHVDKVRFARKSGIKLIHLFEDAWTIDKAKYKSIIKDCLTEKFDNVLSIENDGSIVGDNNFPIYGDYEIIDFIQPQKHNVGKHIYYDSGKVIYRKLKKESIERK